MTTSQSHSVLENPPTQRALDEAHLPVRVKRAAAWTSFMFLYVYVDYLAPFGPDSVDGILKGVVFELDISQTFVVTSLTLMAIPIFMIVASTMLPAGANRITNLVVAAIYVPVTMFNAVIVRLAWAWPRRSGVSS